MRLFAQDRPRTGDRDRTVQGGFHRFGFALFRDDANHFFGRAQRGNGQRQRIRRNRFKAREIPFPHLLLFAGFVLEPEGGLNSGHWAAFGEYCLFGAAALMMLRAWRSGKS